MGATTATVCQTVNSADAGITGRDGITLSSTDFFLNGTSSIEFQAVSSAECEIANYGFSLAIGTRAAEVQDIEVRIVHDSTQFAGDTVSAQLTLDGSVIGTQQITSGLVTSTGWDITYSSWDTVPTAVQLETTSVGVLVAMTNDSAPALSYTIDGVTVTAIYDPLNTVSDRLAERLINYDNLTSQVGGRVFPNKLPQNFKYPSVVYRQIADDIEHAMGGDPYIRHGTYQIACLADNFEDAETIGLTVTSALQRWASSTDTQMIQDVFMEGSFTNWVDVDDGDEGVYNHELNIVIHSHKSSST